MKRYALPTITLLLASPLALAIDQAQGIYFEHPSSNTECTTGASARKFASIPVMVSAGHCAQMTGESVYTLSSQEKIARVIGKQDSQFTGDYSINVLEDESLLSAKIAIAGKTLTITSVATSEDDLPEGEGQIVYAARLNNLEERATLEGKDRQLYATQTLSGQPSQLQNGDSGTIVYTYTDQENNQVKILGIFHGASDTRAFFTPTWVIAAREGISYYTEPVE